MNNHAAVVRQFLKDRSSINIEPTGLPFVTISRQAGAGGHTLARNILGQLDALYPARGGSEGWEVFDQKLCALIAQDEKLGFSFDALVTEEYRSEISQFVHELIRQKASRYAAYKRVFSVVRLLATLGNCVIVGRAGMCVAADMPLGVHIRLIASRETRIKNMMQLMETDELTARNAVRTQDRDRRRLVDDFFGRDIDDPSLYDVVLNMDRVHPGEAAELVARMLNQKLARFPKKFALLT